jgi:threonine/homoserine/homoserine lactone efflux protein
VHLAAVASPGPDFLLVTRNTLRGSARLGTLTAIGIMAGNSVHLFYTLFAASFFGARGEVWFEWIRILGAFYLGWMGVQCVWSFFRPAMKEEPAPGAPPFRASSGTRAFRSGFITSALNAKAAVYFISILSPWVGSGLELPKALLIAFVLMSITGLWFTSVAQLLGIPRFRDGLARQQSRIEFGMGILLMGFALFVLTGKR